MTGFGTSSVETELPAGRVMCEARSVNSRSLDVRLRAPLELGDASLWAACIGGAMQRDRYREAIEAAGLQITASCENDQYRFVSERADNAVRKYGVASISLLARRPE